MPVGVAELLGGVPGDFNFNALPRRERRVEPGPLPVGEALPSGAEDVADPVERISLAAAMAEGVLLDAATDVINRGGAELDNVERVQHRGRVVEFVVEGLLVAGERVRAAIFTSARNCSSRSLIQSAYAFEDRPGTRSSSRARTRPVVSRVRSTIPVSSFGPRPPSATGFVDT